MRGATGLNVPTLLELRGISKSFTGVRVLDSVGLDVNRSEVHAITGENGAGKSTLMNIISGVVQPDSGEIIWDGRPVHVRTPRDAQDLGIAFVHQELALVPQLSAAENVYLGHHVARRGIVNWRRINSRAKQLFSELGHDIDPRRQTDELGLAERQLVEIARALAFESKLIIMDEPTAPLGDDDTERLFAVISRLRDRGVSVIFISHRLKEVFEIADRVTVLRDGRHVLTNNVTATGHDELVRAMVGRDLPERPAADQTRANTTELLRIEGSVKLALNAGEIVGLAGLAGAGRTELLEWLFGAGPPHAARVFIDNEPARIHSPQEAIRHGLALVPDDRKAKGLVLGASIRENIALAGARKHFLIHAAGELRTAGELIGRLRIKATSPAQPVVYLSGGNQQKVVIAKWLNAGARIFLLDEPTRGIDIGSKAEIYDVLRNLTKAGAGVLLASSELDELLRICDRIVVMHRGRFTGELSRAEATEERIMHLATGAGH